MIDSRDLRSGRRLGTSKICERWPSLLQAVATQACTGHSRAARALTVLARARTEHSVLGMRVCVCRRKPVVRPETIVGSVAIQFIDPSGAVTSTFPGRPNSGSATVVVPNYNTQAKVRVRCEQKNLYADSAAFQIS